MPTINETFNCREFAKLRKIKRAAAEKLLGKLSMSWKKFILMAAEALNDLRIQQML